MAESRLGTRSEPTASSLGFSIRDVRVQIAAGVSRFWVYAHGGLLVEPSLKDWSSSNAGLWVVIEASLPDKLSIDGARVPCSEITLAGRTESATRISFEDPQSEKSGTLYPGRLGISVASDGLLDIVNTVEVEQYVASVVAAECWPTFHEEAYRAQAIVTRTFVLYHMMRRGERPFDLTATQRAQVYKGVRNDDAGRKAAAAADYSRGLVCTWRDNGRDRLFCTYFSAACGGASQSAAVFGEEGNVPPLAGGVQCSYCKIAPGDSYRWGPVKLSAPDVFDQLAMRIPEMAELGAIQAIEPLERDSFGRPITLRIRGEDNIIFDILAERFRQIAGPSTMKSTHCRIRVRGDDLVLDAGRGFGHGLGLCQWGAQAQAIDGKAAAQILHYYYPGCRIIRVY